MIEPSEDSGCHRTQHNPLEVNPTDDRRAHRNELRTEMRARRRSINTVDRATAENAMTGMLLAQLSGDHLGVRGKNLGVYHPFDGEISPLAAAELLASQGWDIWLPVVGPDQSMWFERWDPNDTLTENRFGIGEPNTHSQTCGATELDVILVPCVAVDTNGNRLGMGAGFYDRALREHEQSGSHQSTRSGCLPTLIGLAFEVQVAHTIPVESWDVPLDGLITDERVIWTSNGRSN